MTILPLPRSRDVGVDVDNVLGDKITLVPLPALY
jgi:hypothetical protein